MQAEVTFSENTRRTKTSGGTKIIQGINPIRGFQQFIEKSDWDERFSGYEKHIDRFSWTIIIASVIYLIPIWINIFTR